MVTSDSILDSGSEKWDSVDGYDSFLIKKYHKLGQGQQKSPKLLSNKVLKFW